jgi:hypothetical protein
MPTMLRKGKHDEVVWIPLVATKSRRIQQGTTYKVIKEGDERYQF